MGRDDPELTTRTCVACGLPELGRRNPLCAEGFYGDKLVHLRCYSTPAYRAWEDGARAADPAYDRYTNLITHRRLVACPHCGKGLEVSQKGTGMGAEAWPANCTRCHRTGPLSICPYRQTEAYQAIGRLRDDYFRSRHLDTIDARVRQVARAYDDLVAAYPCPCGGQYSLAAEPRCPRCDGVVTDSPFHVVDEPLGDARWAELKAKFMDVPTPEDWDDAAGWERYCAALSDARAAYDGDDLGSFEGDALTGLVRHLRGRGCTSVWLPGCGVSRLPRLLAAFGFAVHATDISETAVRFQAGDRSAAMAARAMPAGADLPASPGPSQPPSTTSAPRTATPRSTSC